MPSQPKASETPKQADPSLCRQAPLPSRPRTSWQPLPLVREHGAWIMLVTPFVMALAAPGEVESWAAVGILSLATAAVFLAQEGWRLWLPRRRKTPLNRWVLVLGAAGLLLTLPLLFVWDRHALIWVGVMGGLVLAAQSALIILPGRRDKALWARLMAVPGITLTGPATIIAARGDFDHSAWMVWITSSAIFSSGVVFIAMLVAAARQHHRIDRGMRLKVGRNNLIWHGALLLLVIGWMSTLSPLAALCVGGALTPLLLRCGLGQARMTRSLPSMRRIGLIETALTTLSAGLMIAALYLGA